MTSQVSNYSINRSLKQLGSSAHSARRHFLRGSVAISAVLGLLPGGLSMALLADGSEESIKYASSTWPVAFIHIPKTGGTAIEDAAERLHVRWGSRDKHLKGVTKMPDGNNCSTYHVPYGLLESLDGEAAEAYANKSRFCVTRDPAERAVSEYTYLLNQDWGSDFAEEQHTGLRYFPECTKEGLNYFVNRTLTMLKNGTRYIDDCHHLPQVDFIWNDSGKQVCHHVLRAENLIDSFNELMIKFGRSVRLSPATDVHSSSIHCPNLSVQNLTEDTMALLTEVYADDYRLLNYSLPGEGR